MILTEWVDRWKGGKHTQRSEEPPVLAAGESVLQSLLDGLLGLLALGDLLESVLADNTLQTLQLEGVASRHQVVVVDDLDERLDTAALLDHLLAHATGDLGRVALDTGDDGVGEGVRLGASVVRLDNDNLFPSWLACLTLSKSCDSQGPSLDSMSIFQSSGPAIMQKKIPPIQTSLFFRKE